MFVICILMLAVLYHYCAAAVIQVHSSKVKGEVNLNVKCMRGKAVFESREMIGYGYGCWQQ